MTDEIPEASSHASRGGQAKPPSSDQGIDWEGAGRVIGRLAGRAGSFLGKASAVAKNQGEKVQQLGVAGIFQKIWDEAGDFVKRGTDRENIARLKELASLAKENTAELSEGAAERIANIYGDCTGQTATAAEVKQVALRFGMMALVTFVTASVLGRAGAAQNLFSQVRKMAPGFGSDEGQVRFDGSFEERTAQFYSNNGGTEGSTPVIDADAVVIDLE